MNLFFGLNLKKFLKVNIIEDKTLDIPDRFQ